MPTNAQLTKVLAEMQAYSPSTLLEMFEIDLTPFADYYAIPTGDANRKIRIFNGYNERITAGLANTNLIWNALSYTARPCKFSGLDISSAGQVPSPTLEISDLDLFFSPKIRAYGGMVGAEVTRRRTFAKFIDAGNFISGTNANADPNAAYPDDVFRIERLVEEAAGKVTFQLSPSWDVEGVQLPRRQVVANICPWVYKSSPCTWAVGTGATVDTISGNSVVAASTYVEKAVANVSSAGSGATATVTKTGAGTVYAGVTTITIVNPGTGYAINDTLKILGTDLGGNSPANDLFFTMRTLGDRYYDEFDQETTANLDRCGKRHTSCRIRFGYRVMPFGGFVGAGLYGKPI